MGAYAAGQTDSEAAPVLKVGPFATWLQQRAFDATDADAAGGDGWVDATGERSNREPRVLALALFVVEHGGDLTEHVRAWRAAARAAGRGTGRDVDLFGVRQAPAAAEREVGRPRRQIAAPTLAPDEASSPARAFRVLFWPRHPKLARWLDTLEHAAGETRPPERRSVRAGPSDAGAPRTTTAASTPVGAWPHHDVDPRCDPHVIYAAARRAWRQEWQRLGRATAGSTPDAVLHTTHPRRRVCEPTRAAGSAKRDPTAARRAAPHPATPGGTAPDMPPPTARHTFADDEVFATYVLAEALRRSIRDVAGGGDVLGCPLPPRPTARTCRRRMDAFWVDPHVGPFVRQRLGAIGAHRDARPHGRRGPADRP